MLTQTFPRKPSHSPTSLVTQSLEVSTNLWPCPESLATSLLDLTWLLFPFWPLNLYSSSLNCFRPFVANRERGWKHIFGFANSQRVLLFAMHAAMLVLPGATWWKTHQFHLVLAVARGALPQVGDGSGLLSTEELHTLHPISPEAISLSVKWGSDALSAPSVRNYGTASMADLQKFAFLFLFVQKHHIMKLTAGIGMKILFYDLYKTKKTTQPQKNSRFWTLRTRFHWWDFPGPPLCPEYDAF